MYCKKCGNKIDESVKFCPKCGNQIVLEDVKKIREYENAKQNHNGSKLWLIIFLLLVLMGVVVWLVKGKTPIEESQEKKNSIEGTYIGESRDWLLQIYEDGTLHMDDDSGEYEKIAENKWIIMIDGYAFDLEGSLTEEGNLYITSEHSNWDAEMFYRQDMTSNNS